MSELVPVDVGAVVRSDPEGFHALQHRLGLLVSDAVKAQEYVAALSRRMRRNAQLAVTTAEKAGAAEVDTREVGQILEVAIALGGVADSAAALASRAEAFALAAETARAAHDAEYRGVYEAVQAVGGVQAKPGFYQSR